MNRRDEFESVIIDPVPDGRAVNNIYIQAMLEGAAFERESERCRMEAENAFKDVGSMKAEGRRRAAGQADRMLPSHERAIDVKTNTMKAMVDAKADHAYYSSQATMYANLAAMKFAKAAAILAMKRR